MEQTQIIFFGNIHFSLNTTLSELKDVIIFIYITTYPEQPLCWDDFPQANC